MLARFLSLPPTPKARKELFLLFRIPSLPTLLFKHASPPIRHPLTFFSKALKRASTRKPLICAASAARRRSLKYLLRFGTRAKIFGRSPTQKKPPSPKPALFPQTSRVPSTSSAAPPTLRSSVGGR